MTRSNGMTSPLLGHVSPNPNSIQPQSTDYRNFHKDMITNTASNILRTEKKRNNLTDVSILYAVYNGIKCVLNERFFTF